MLLEFIRANDTLVDRVTLEKVMDGHKVAMNDALNQIYWRTLRFRVNDSGKGLLVRVYQGAISTKWAHKK